MEIDHEIMSVAILPHLLIQEGQLSVIDKESTQVLVNPFMSSVPFYHNSLNQSISKSWVSGYFLLLQCFIEIPVLNANSVDTDQMPLFAASDLGLHYLPITFLEVSRLKWVKHMED